MPSKPEPSMEEYAAAKKKKSTAVRFVKVEKARNGFIARREYDNYDIEQARKPEIYKDLEGVMDCLRDAFGGSKKEY